jgi:holin-like protein
MNFLNGITILLIYQLVGEVSVLLLKIPLPGPVLGMVLLFITLLLRKGMADSMGSTSTALLNHLPLLFVPAGVGIVVHFDRIMNEWIPISIALVLSTIITMAATAIIMQTCNRICSRNSKRDG